MKLLFVHDHRFKADNSTIYSDAFPYSVWRRYLKSFSELSVFARCSESLFDPRQTVLSSGKNVRFHFGDDISSLRSQLTPRKVKEAKRRLRYLVQESDAIIARLPSVYGLIAADFANRLRKPWAVEVVGCAWDSLWHHGSWQGKAYAPILTKKTRTAVASAPFALYVTKEFLQNRYPCSGVTTHCSNVELPEPDASVFERRIKKILCSPSGKPLVLGLIGTLSTRYKGIQSVVSALSEIRNDLPPVIFRVLGGGDSVPWRLEAKRRGVEDITYFDGTLPSGGPVFDWLDEVDIYLQPSLTEGLPRSLIEAMSRGCPAIGSSCGGMPELLDSKCLIRPGSAADLGKLLRRFATDREWHLEQARRNWICAKEYSSVTLDKRRLDFWCKFAEYAEMNG